MKQNNNFIESTKTAFGVKTISNKLIDETLQAAHNAQRKRIAVLFNKYEERPIRSVRCLDADAYIRPHMHEYADLYEILAPLYGDFKLLIFNSKGVIIDIIPLNYQANDDKDVKVVEIPAFIYHTVVCMSQKGAFLEINSLSNTPTISDMTFPSWAPEEGSPRAHETLHLFKSAHVGTIIK